MNVEFQQLVDMDRIRVLLESHVRLSGLACGIMDRDGAIIVAAGLQEVCTRFHWEEPTAFARCWRNDPEIKAALQGDTKELFECRCKNGMTNIAIPIMIDGHSRALFFAGQFFYDDAPPDREAFIAGAEEMGFDCETYLAALERVPVFSREYVRGTVQFLHSMVQVIAEAGQNRLELAREMEERKRSGRDLFLLNHALNNSRDAVYLIDETLRFIYVNDVACRVLGYTREELLDRGITDIDPDLRAQSLTRIMQATRAIGTNTIETRHRTRDGRIFPVEVTGTFFEFEGHCYNLALARDISEAKNADRQIGLLTHALDQVREGAFLIDIPGRVLYVNQEACRSLEYERDELVGLSVMDFDAGFTPEQAEDVFAEILRKGSLTFETCHRTRSGRIIPVEITSSLFDYGGVRYILALVRDISERKRMEQAMRESEERFRLLVELSPDLIFIRHRDRIVYANPAAARIVGAGSPEELVGRSVLDFALPERRDCLTALIAANDEKPVGTVMPSYEGTLMRLDGSQLPVELTAVRFQYRGMSCSQQIMRDISERSQAERLTRARLRMLETTHKADVSLDDALRLVLDEIEAQTGSSIGFYHFLHEDQQTLSLQNWSTRTFASMCSAEGKGRHYAVADAGVWADCVRERRPVIHNDYAALPQRRGMPEGHAAVVRELVVPIFRNSRIVAIIGLGNKPVNYTEGDIQTAVHLGDFSWEIVSRKQTEESLRLLNARFLMAAEAAGFGVWDWDVRGNRLEWDDRMYALYDADRQAFSGAYEAWLARVHPDDRERCNEISEQARRGEREYDTEFRVVWPDGSVRHLKAHGQVIKDAEGGPARMIGCQFRHHRAQRG